MGAPPHPSDGPGFAGPVHAPVKGAAIRLTGRGAFMTIAALVLLTVLLGAVVLPAMSRGGFVELLGVAAICLAVLLGERWLRSR